MSEPTAPPSPAEEPLCFYDTPQKLKYHPGMIALSRAAAGAWLLGELARGEMHFPFNDQNGTPEWIRSIALQTVEDGIEEARQEFEEAILRAVTA